MRLRVKASGLSYRANSNRTSPVCARCVYVCSVCWVRAAWARAPVQATAATQREQANERTWAGEDFPAGQPQLSIAITWPYVCVRARARARACVFVFVWIQTRSAVCCTLFMDILVCDLPVREGFLAHIHNVDGTQMYVARRHAMWLTPNSSPEDEIYVQL